MAARENQGYIIGIIILSILTVVLLLLTVLSTMKAYENHDNWTAADTETAYFRALADTQKVKSDVIAAYVGIEGVSVAEVPTLLNSIDRFVGQVDAARAGDITSIRDSAEKIRGIYEDDMKLTKSISSQQADLADLTYKGTIRKFSATVQGLTRTLVDNDQLKAQALQDSKDQLERLQASVEEKTKSVEDLTDRLAKEEQRNAAKENEYQTQLESAQAANEQLAVEAQESLEIKANEIAGLQGQLSEINEQVVILKEKVNYYEGGERFYLPDGQITQVAHNSKDVYINRGSADGLKNGMTFTVIDNSNDQFEKDQPYKAKIQVTKITGPHQAKARITEPGADPILPKDYIVTITWDPGFSVPIAIAGFIDLDGDGSSDLQKLIQQIRRNGGNVVASHDTDGNITGSIDATTRYFVQGPSGRTGVSYSGNASRASQKLNAQAKKFNVEQIGLRDLLNWMGQHLASNTQQLDSGLSTNSAEFPRRSRTGSGSKLLGGGASPSGSGSSNTDGSGSR